MSSVAEEHDNHYKLATDSSSHTLLLTEQATFGHRISLN